MVKIMKKTPSGWGTGLEDINIISCKKDDESPWNFTCIPTEEAKLSDEKIHRLTGRELEISDVGLVRVRPSSTITALMFGRQKLKAWVDTGIIHIQPQ